MKKEELYKHYACNKKLKTYHYKVLLLLMQRSMTQTEICPILEISKQNLYKVCKDLKSIGYIGYGEIIGNNKYLKINLNPNIQVVGQVSISNFITEKS